MANAFTGADVLDRIRALEREVASALDEKCQRLGYEIVMGRATFGLETRRRHAELRIRLLTYIRHSRWTMVPLAPVIYGCVLPLLLLDLFVSAYQATCFPAFGIPRVARADHFVFDRAGLGYLNLLERLNCAYCSYATGLLAYATEIAARTEQHWCPVKHARQPHAPHSRYRKFFDYGDAEAYSRLVENLRADYRDLMTSAKSPPPAANHSPFDTGGPEARQ